MNLPSYRDGLRKFSLIPIQAFLKQKFDGLATCQIHGNDGMPFFGPESFSMSIHSHAYIWLTGFSSFSFNDLLSEYL